MSKKVLVCGFFFKNNLGDNLFIEAFQELFPTLSFIFVDEIKESDLIDIDAVFIGGGSFLYNAPPIGKNLEKLLTMKLYYIGVGLETDINPIHKQLIAKAQLLAIRTPQFKDKGLSLNKNTITIPDIVYALQGNVELAKKEPKSILVIPNLVVVPYHSDSNWRYVSWNYYKSEMSQFLDEKINDGWNVSFWSFCNNQFGNDEWNSIEVINQMTSRCSVKIIPYQNFSFKEAAKLASSFAYCITQRYHGGIVCDMVKTNHVNIYHHDKLKVGNALSYYGLTKAALHESFNKNESNQVIDLNIFDKLKSMVQI